MANRHIILRATVARVDIPHANDRAPWAHVYFKESTTMNPPVERLPGD